MKELLRKNIRELVPYSCARDEFEGSAEVFLDANENYYDYSCLGYNRYPDPHCKDLRVEIERKMNLPFDNTVIGNGSDELIDNLIRMFCEPNNDTILIMPPTYGAYKVFSDISAVKCQTLPLLDDFSIDMKGFKSFSERNIKPKGKCKITFICSPNNPTGESQCIEEIEKMLQTFNGIIVVDEAYSEFSYKESAVSLIGKYDNLVVLKTFSKCWGLAGARLGIMIASKEICNIMNKVKAPYNVGIPAQQAGLDQLKLSDEILKEKAELIDRRNYYSNQFNSIDIVEKVYPSDANFLLLKTKDSNKICKLLQDDGIIIRNRTKDLNCSNCIRITIGSSKECEIVFKKMSEMKI